MSANRDPLRFFWWLTTFSWAMVIFWMSTRTFNKDWSEGLLFKLLEALQIQLSIPWMKIIHAASRKLAHLTEYAILSFLIYQSLNSRTRGWSARYAVWAILGAAFYSLFDELHQSFVPERTPAFVDCLIDTTGAVMAMALVYWRELRCQIKLS